MPTRRLKAFVLCLGALVVPAGTAKADLLQAHATTNAEARPNSPVAPTLDDHKNVPIVDGSAPIVSGVTRPDHFTARATVDPKFNNGVYLSPTLSAEAETAFKAGSLNYVTTASATLDYEIRLISFQALVPLRFYASASAESGSNRPDTDSLVLSYADLTVTYFNKDLREVTVSKHACSSLNPSACRGAASSFETGPEAFGLVLSNAAISVHMQVGASANLFDQVGLLADATRSKVTLDPYFFIDPDFLLANPETRIEISPGIGNAAVATPEPATWALLTCGFGLAGGSLRRRRAAAAT